MIYEKQIRHGGQPGPIGMYSRWVVHRVRPNKKYCQRCTSYAALYARRRNAKMVKEKNFQQLDFVSAWGQVRKGERAVL